MAHVLFNDLTAAHRSLQAELSEAIERVVSDNAFIGGRAVDSFEKDFAKFSGRRFCVGVNSGTDALELALRASNPEPGSHALLPTNSYIATAEAAVRAGLRPTLVDCDPEYQLMDMAAAESLIRNDPSVGAVVPVHLNGQMAAIEDLDEALAECPKIVVVEDGAQSHGAERWGSVPGAANRAVATSFYPGKNLGAFGDAGAVLTDSDELAAAVRVMGNHGSINKYQHVSYGCNSRLDGIQAAVLSVKLSRLRIWNEARQRAAAIYEELLDDAAEAGLIKLPKTLEGNSHIWHIYSVRVAPALRDRVMQRLACAGVQTGIHYPVPIHLQPAFSWLGYEAGQFPNAEAAAQQLISLPMHPYLELDDQRRVVREVVAAIKGGS